MIQHNGINYELLWCSDIDRDGMYMELNRLHNNSRKLVAEVFYSDITHEFTFSCFVENIPLDLIELLIQEAKKTLPPIDKSE